MIEPQNPQCVQTSVSGSAVVEDKIIYDSNGGWAKQSFID